MPFFTEYFTSPGGLDWVDGTAPDNRTPKEAPYSFSPHFLWRDFEKGDAPKGTTTIYSDRMSEWDREKAREAFKGMPSYGQLTREQCRKIIHRYYDGKAECVGYAYGCNLYNGYPYGIFYVRERA